MSSSYVGKPCPKCGHVRTETETAPDWQCPKCGIVYAKFGQAAPPPKPGAASRPAPMVEAGAEESTGLAKLAHLSTLANYLLPPLGTLSAIALWVAKSGQDELAVDSAKEALNFQISITLWAVAIVLPFFLFPPWIFVASLLLVALLVAGLILPVIAMIRVGGGSRYYYPYTWHIFGEPPAD